MRVSGGVTHTRPIVTRHLLTASLSLLASFAFTDRKTSEDPTQDTYTISIARYLQTLERSAVKPELLFRGF